jgi:hypothetical protein
MQSNQLLGKVSPQLEEAVLNGLFPWNTPLIRASYPINLVRSC